jgi:hypothetical protein
MYVNVSETRKKSNLEYKVAGRCGFPLMRFHTNPGVLSMETGKKNTKAIALAVSM